MPLGYAVALGLGLYSPQRENQRHHDLKNPDLLARSCFRPSWSVLPGDGSSASVGLINYLLQCIGLDGIKWATNPTAAFVTTIIAGIWSGCGTNMLIFIGALKQVPGELLEAANLDGQINGSHSTYHTAPFKTGFLHGHPFFP